MTEWPDQLIQDLARRKCILVIGSGLSAQSAALSGARPPMWKKFLEDSYEALPDASKKKHIRDAIKNGDYLHACEWIKKRMDERWIDHLRNTFQRPGYPPSEAHEYVFKLDSRIVFSLNFDDIFERAANTYQPGTYVVKSYHDPDVSEFLRKDARYVVKIHGSLNTPAAMIFTQEEYAAARTKNSSFYNALEASLLTHSFFFIGVGTSDPDISLLLENHSFQFRNSSPHYYLCTNDINVDLEYSLRRNRNLKTIKYKKIDEHHSGLSKALQSLVESVDLKRQEIAKTQNW